MVNTSGLLITCCSTQTEKREFPHSTHKIELFLFLTEHHTTFFPFFSVVYNVNKKKKKYGFLHVFTVDIVGAASDRVYPQKSVYIANTYSLVEIHFL